MTARTLEEIEAEYAKGRGNGAPHMAPLGVMIDNFPCLLAIAQEQRAEIARLKRFEEIVIGSEKALAELVKNHKMPGPVFENCDPGFLKS